MSDSTLGAYNIADLREMARRRLPKGIFEFIDRGNEDDTALRNNRAALDRIKLKPRTLVDVSKRSQQITLFGKRQPMPIVIGPTGTTGQVWYRGEIALARAAAAAGIPFTLATGSTTALEQVIEQGGGGRMWFQLYIWPERTVAYEMVERVRKAGFEALVVTVDSPVSPNREFNLRNGFTLPFKFTPRSTADVLMHPRWLFGTIARYVLTTGMPRYENYPGSIRSKMTAQPMGYSMPKNDSLTWEDLRELRKMWPRTLIAKGILDARDAVLAADCGADGVVLSNHGGILVDSAIAPIDVLAETVEAVGKRIPVFIDSGYRRGSDIIKALALGATAVWIGRPTLYGTAAAGQAGAARAIAILRDEIDRVLALIGCPDVAALNPEYVVLPRAR